MISARPSRLAGPLGRRLAVVAATGVLWACSAAHDDGGAITADDQRQLNDAAAMLDSNSVDPALMNDHESSAHD